MQGGRPRDDNSVMSESAERVVFFEDEGYTRLLPLVYYRAVFDLRCGARTLRERAQAVLGAKRVTLYVREMLHRFMVDKHGGEVASRVDGPGRTLFVNGRCFLTEPIEPAAHNVVGRKGGEVAYVWADAELAGRLSAAVFLDGDQLAEVLSGLPEREADVRLIEYPWHLVHRNVEALEADWGMLGGAGIDGTVYEGAHLLGRENISIGPGAVIKPGSVLDAEHGPIMIGGGVTVKPNCTLEGPLYIGPNSLIQPGAVISEGVSIGPVCKVGGELESSIIHGYSNKQHDGFLGHSYIGQWVNLAADTINSDLKNTYGPVRVPINGRSVDSGEMFVGLTMGDHSKTSVNTMFSTGSVVGFGCSVFTSGFAPLFLPSFSWLTDEGRTEAIVEKVVEVARRVMARRRVVLGEAEGALFAAIREQAHGQEQVWS